MTLLGVRGLFGRSGPQGRVAGAQTAGGSLSAPPRRCSAAVLDVKESKGLVLGQNVARVFKRQIWGCRRIYNNKASGRSTSAGQTAGRLRVATAVCYGWRNHGLDRRHHREGVRTAWETQEAAKAAGSFRDVRTWTNRQALQAAAAGGLAMSVPGAHAVALTADMAWLLHKLAVCSWGVGGIHRKPLRPLLNLQIILAHWSLIRKKHSKLASARSPSAAPSTCWARRAFSSLGLQ